MFLSGPKLTLRTSPLERILIITSSIFIIISWLIPITMWNKIPDTVPSSFLFSGVPIRWISKYNLFVIPLVITIIYVSLIFLCKIPHYFNYMVKITKENAQAQYRNAIQLILFLNLELAVFMLYVSTMSINISLDKASTLGTIPIILFVIILFSTLIYFTRKMYKLK